MVFRCFVEKKPGFDGAARALCRELTEQLGVRGLERVRVLNRYDVEGVDAAVYAAARTAVFSEPQVDAIWDETMPPVEGPHALTAVEALPGQYDQRADSAAQCIQLMTGGDRPAVAAAAVYVLLGQVPDADLEKVKKYLINPVESREASLDKPATLTQIYPVPGDVPVLEGFRARTEEALGEILEQYGLAMDLGDLAFLQAYFREEERRDPTLTRIFGQCVDAVVHCPYGAWPSQCYNYYDNDSHALKEYDKASKYQDKADAVEQLAKAAAKAVKALEKAPADEKLKLAAEAAEKAAKAAAAGELIPETFEDYLNKWVYGCKDQAELLDKIGGSRLMRLKNEPHLGYSTTH